MSHTLRVFIAEDNVLERGALRDIILAAPFPTSVRETDNGREALILLTELGDILIDLAFLDVGLPGMSGLEALGGARFLGNRTMTVIMSHTVSERRKVLARDLKAYDYMLKPFTTGQVNGLLEAAYGNCARWRILVADDRDDVRDGVIATLENALGDVAITPAANFAEVKDAVNRKVFDAVLLDLHMYDENAIATLRYLKRWFPKMKVVLMTSNPVRKEIIEAGEVGLDGFLQKPFSNREAKQVFFRAFRMKLPETTDLYKDDPHLFSEIRDTAPAPGPKAKAMTDTGDGEAASQVA